jgi:hypothetical protein
MLRVGSRDENRRRIHHQRRKTRFCIITDQQHVGFVLAAALASEWPRATFRERRPAPLAMLSSFRSSSQKLPTQITPPLPRANVARRILLVPPGSPERVPQARDVRTIADISNGQRRRHRLKTLPSSARAAGSANSLRRRSVTTVKKNVPPAIHARRYRGMPQPTRSLSEFQISRRNQGDSASSGRNVLCQGDRTRVPVSSGRAWPTSLKRESFRATRGHGPMMKTPASPGECIHVCVSSDGFPHPSTVGVIE